MDFALEELESWILRHGGATVPLRRRQGCAFAAQAAARLCRVPWRLLLSEDVARRSCGQLCQAAEEFSPTPGLLLLTALLLQEKVAPDSFFAPYIQVLTEDLSHIPAQWPECRLQSIKGSHLERQVRSRRHQLALEFALLQSVGLSVSWEDFLWARCIVSSRAYALRGQRCLVPWGDLLNHGGPEASVGYHLQGEGDECEFVMELKGPLSEGQELLQSYGEKTNATLLLDYGFVLLGAPPAKVGLRLPRGLVEVGGHDFQKLWPLLRTEGESPRAVEAGALEGLRHVVEQTLQKLPKLESSLDTWRGNCAQVIEEEAEVLRFLLVLTELGLAKLARKPRETSLGGFHVLWQEAARAYLEELEQM